jgi:hypothetical protein
MSMIPSTYIVGNNRFLLDANVFLGCLLETLCFTVSGLIRTKNGYSDICEYIRYNYGSDDSKQL